MLNLAINTPQSAERCRRATLATAIIAAILLPSLVSAGHASNTFPRRGGYKIQTPHPYDDPAYQRDLAQLDLVIINPFPGWESATNTTFREVVTAIKSYNADTLVFGYVAINESKLRSGTAFTGIYEKLEAEEWWLYEQGAAGIPVTSTWGDTFGITNYTNFAPRDSQGLRFNTWVSRWLYQEILEGAGFDGVFTDNFFWKPRVNGDWNRDGVSDSRNNADTQRWHREGMMTHVNEMRSLMPGKYVLGNVADWGPSGVVYPEFEQQLEGGVLEWILGNTFSPEGQDWRGTNNGWGSWQEMMDQYYKVMASVAEPKLVVFQQLGDSSDYQAFRYGLASCLMNDAYYDFLDASDEAAAVVGFDELEINLGSAVSYPPTQPWQNGVYRRDFEYGVVLVNPRGNGNQVLDLEDGLSRLVGQQDPQHNNGERSAIVRLNDRDGIILLRDVAQRIPRAPQLLTVQ